jgi:hypothetical protein
MHSAICILAINILDFVYSLPKNKQTDPLPSVKKTMLSAENTNLLVNLLLVGNIQISKAVLSLINDHFNSHYGLY